MSPRTLRISLLLLWASLTPNLAWAQTWPDRPIRIIIGFAAGSLADISSRVVGDVMSKDLGQPFIVEIRPGAGGNIAADAVAKAEPDGYSLYLGNIANIISRAMKVGTTVDLAKDFKPVGLLCYAPSILVVHPAVKANSVKELIALAKAQPGTLNYGSAGVGTMGHLTGELFNLMAGVKMVHVPYKGTAQATQDVVGGSLQLTFAPSSTALGLLEGKQLRALGWTTLTRQSTLPDLPTISEEGLSGFETTLWFGINAPSRTPDPIVKRLSDSLASALKTEAVGKAFRAQGIEPLIGGPVEYGKYIAAETSKWTEVVATAGLAK